jgi:hypothetical protein
VSQKTDFVSDPDPLSDEERRARNRETLPGFLFGIFTLILAAAGIIWLLVASMSG